MNAMRSEINEMARASNGFERNWIKPFQSTHKAEALGRFYLMNQAPPEFDTQFGHLLDWTVYIYEHCCISGC